MIGHRYSTAGIRQPDVRTLLTNYFKALSSKRFDDIGTRKVPR